MSDRAVQFGAFAALTGYYDIIEKRNEIIPRRRELSEDMAEILSEKISHINRGSEISVCHLTENGYVSAAGIVSDINFEKRFMFIDDKKILFDDIYEIN